jgi:hypothetical protein
MTRQGQRVQFSGHSGTVPRRCRWVLSAPVPRYAAHRPTPRISHAPAGPPNPAAAMARPADDQQRRAGRVQPPDRVADASVVVRRDGEVPDDPGFRARPRPRRPRSSRRAASRGAGRAPTARSCRTPPVSRPPGRSIAALSAAWTCDRPAGWPGRAGSSLARIKTAAVGGVGGAGNVVHEPFLMHLIQALLAVFGKALAVAADVRVKVEKHCARVCSAVHKHARGHRPQFGIMPVIAVKLIMTGSWVGCS